jgi:hydrogenase-4 component B
MGLFGGLERAMTAIAVIIAISLAALSGVPGFVLSRSSRRGDRISVALLVLAALVDFVGILPLLAGAEAVTVWVDWPIPNAAFALRIDALAAFFLLPIFAVSALTAIYALEYWPAEKHPHGSRTLRLTYGLIVAGLATQTIAANSILFLAGWEVTALAAFVAIATEDRVKEVRTASYLYLVTTRAGTLCLFAMFTLLHASTGSFALEPLASLPSARASAIFALALAGFGLKAGMMPLHFWLPSAHAAAPTHVSALMSGVLIKIGIYGLLRVTSLLPPGPEWWGLSLLGLGVLSGVLGVAYAIGQHQVKRLLAYHSIENIGIILMGLGLAVLGRTLERPGLATLGLAGCLLHVWNHALFKSLLFLATGSVIHSTGTGDIDQLGGLFRHMRRTGLLFLCGAIAICGLPPLNGFVSELFVYLGLFDAIALPSGSAWMSSAFAAPLLALIGTLALACFVKVFGAVFLGNARSERAKTGHDSGASMLGPMAVLAGLCVFIGLAPQLVSGCLDHAMQAVWTGTASLSIASIVPLFTVSGAHALLFLIVALASLFLVGRLRRAPISAGPTWDCGYAAPSARMQYSSSSFADMLVRLFGWALTPTEHREPPRGLFPASVRYARHVQDLVLDRVLRPSIASAAASLLRLRWLQPGRLHLYLLYIAVTLIALLAWVDGGRP